MSFSAYEVTIPVMDRGLNILENYVDEAERLAGAYGRPVSEILDARLAPDMLSFAEQILVLCSKVERHASALVKREEPAVPADNATPDGLKARLRATRAYLESLPEEDVLAADTHTYHLKEAFARGYLAGGDYILSLVLPDFFFHQAMAHAILRHLGAPIGKRTFLGHLELEAGGYT